LWGLDIRPEKSAEFTVSLKNRYDQPLKLKLEVLSLPEGWKAEFLTREDKEGRLSSLMLPAGEEQEFTVKVKTIPKRYRRALSDYNCSGERRQKSYPAA